VVYFEKKVTMNWSMCLCYFCVNECDVLGCNLYDDIWDVPIKLGLENKWASIRIKISFCSFRLITQLGWAFLQKNSGL